MTRSGVAGSGGPRLFGLVACRTRSAALSARARQLTPQSIEKEAEPMSQARVDARWRDISYDREELLEEPPSRRTIVIRGQVADRHMPARRRPAEVQRRALANPDRFAMWAVLLGMLLV